MPTIKFVNEKKTVEVPKGTNLRTAALQAGVDVYRGIDRVLHCPGLGLCTTCKVRIAKGVENVSRQGVWEKANMLKIPMTMFARIGHEEELRLSCRTTVEGDIEVETHPSMNWHGEKFWG
ncbi:MAG: hypothetical protein WD066_05870 [Planctomycetaceae bacterium]